MALFGLTIVLVSPFRAWMVDWYGPRRALPPMAAGFAAILIAIAVIPARSGVNDAAIAVLAAAAGACAPPLGVVMRTLWSAMVDDRDVLQTAYSLDGVVLARTPLAVPLTGRTQVPWRRPRRFPPHPVVLGDQDGVDAVEPLTQGVAGSWHA